MILDVHTHLFLPEAAQDPQGYARHWAEPHWQALVAPEQGPSRQGWALVDQMLRAMDQAGVDRAVVQGWYWENPATTEANNAQVLELLAPHRDRLIPFAALNPAREPEVLLDQAQRWYEAGFAGFGELSAAAQGFSLSGASFRAFAAWAESHRLPICLHVNEPVARPRPGWSPESLQDYLELGLNFPKLPLLLAHLGGGLLLFAANRAVRKLIAQTSLHFDTAALPLLYHANLLGSLDAETILPRVLFGSDFPLLVGPAGETNPSWQPSIDYLKKSPLPPTAVDAILHTNALRWLPEW